MPKKMTDIEALEKNIVELATAIEDWKYEYQNGCRDPFWSDGVNLNLVRNHIEYYKREIEKLSQKLNMPLPDVWYAETPQILSDDFYAKSDKMQENPKDIGADYIETKYGQLRLFNAAPNIKNTERSNIDQKDKLIPLYNKFINLIKLNWKDFLITMAGTYKHNFNNQVMIFGQSPTSSLVADERTWNKANRYLNFGASCIVTIGVKNNCIVEQRLYDISQTYGDGLNSHIDKFTLNEAEEVSLYESVSAQLNISNNTKQYVLQQLAEHEWSDSSEELTKYSQIIQCSAYFVVCQKLQQPIEQFAHILARLDITDAHTVQLVGKAVSKLARKLLDNIENHINKIRGVEYANYHNRQQGVSNSSKRTFEESSNRHYLQAQPKRNGGTNTRPHAGNNTVGGQLSFGQIRTETDEVYERRTQQPLHRVGDERHVDETATSTGERNQGNEADNYGTDGEKTATSNSKRPQDDITAHGDVGSSSGGRSVDSIVSTDLNFNHDVSDFDYGVTKAKYKSNIEAIKLLKRLEQQNAQATHNEQLILSRYTGFGGIPKVFDEQAADWSNEFLELKETLTPSEYERARASTTTAFYTPPYVIQAMYNGLLSLGLKGNCSILDPACATGNFFGSLPPQLKNCELHGIEIDEIPGKIARQLYPASNIKITGYQDMTSPDNQFDFAVGNVPFGDYRVFDERYNKEKFLIHDYFFAKTIDKVKPNGIIAFITSKGTLDKENPTFRKYIARRAELIGAIRLPDNVFKGIGGTEVTSDILFLQKRPHEVVQEPEWVHLGLTDEGVPVNQYFLDNPQNMLGTMIWTSSQFGKKTTLKAFNDEDLKHSLAEAINSFTHDRDIAVELALSPNDFEETAETLSATPDIKNFTYTIVNDKLYFRENDELLLQHENAKTESRIRGLHEIRLALREIINLQENEYTDATFTASLENLNFVYDRFIKKHGNISDRLNKRAFIDDADMPLLLSIEDKDKDGNIVKSRIFTEPTIRPRQKLIPKTYEDLITLSMTQLGYINIAYMAQSFNVEPHDVIANLKGKIYLNPLSSGDDFHNSLFEYMEFMRQRDLDVDVERVWQYIASETADTKYWEHTDDYLTGNVKSKLDYAEIMAQRFPEVYTENVTSLKQAQPEPLTIDQIDYKLGSSWIDLKYIRQFIIEISQMPEYLQQQDDKEDKNRICLTYNKFTDTYTIYNKRYCNTVQTTSVFGTERRNFFSIVEDCLNLKESRVYDIVPHVTKSGNKTTKNVLNVKETQLARQRQELIKNEFKNWMSSDAERLSAIAAAYNEKFNVYKVRQFDGSQLVYPGMTDNIKLRKHQNDAVARCLYSGQNVLLGHVVGAGKTYTMIAAASELKRLGISNKPLIVVPNHLTEQWGEDWLKLYPSANILVATKKDFEPLNRKRFVGKICTGDYDAIIIGHTQFEKIPMSPEYISAELKEQIDDISSALSEMSNDEGVKRFTIKQLEAQKERLETRLKELSSNKRKDDMLTFEQTGLDRLFVDEAHYYKNCYVSTKLSNVAGITTTSAQKSFDMLMKTKYISNKNDGQGVVFATGTPISNSITEMFVLQRYLQPNALQDAGLSYFDDWISTFGQTKMVLELKPEGTGYRMRTRISKFNNMPELISMFSQVADIKVATDLNLPVPSLKNDAPIIVVSKPSEYIKSFIQQLAERAEKIRNGEVEPYIDNMLKVTNEGRAVAIDARLIDVNAPVSSDSKIYQCCDNIKSVYDEGDADKVSQLVFLDTGIWIYQLIKDELISKGIPESEIAFIGDANNEEQKATLFSKVRNGQIRVLIGSTQKMGAGTNVQDRLMAIHHLDCPWRPSDIEQRDGRGVRQGNLLDSIYLFRYVTENTFDAYLWQTQENKQTFISQVMTNKSIARSCDDIDDAVLDCAEVKMLATGDPTIKEKMQLDNDIYMLQNEKSAHLKQCVRLQNIISEAPQKIDELETNITRLTADIKTISENRTEDFQMKVGGIQFFERVKAGEALMKLLNGSKTGQETVLGEFNGISITTLKERNFEGTYIYLSGEYEHEICVISSPSGCITRLENACENYPGMLTKATSDLSAIKKEVAIATVEVKKPFAGEPMLKEKLERQVTLNLNFESNNAAEQVIEDVAGEDIENLPEKVSLEVYTVGDFLEFFNQDAILVSQLLEITLTSRMVNGTRTPMVGIPKHRYDDCAGKIAESGYSIIQKELSPIIQNKKQVIER